MSHLGLVVGVAVLFELENGVVGDFLGYAYAFVVFPDIGDKSQSAKKIEEMLVLFAKLDGHRAPPERTLCGFFRIGVVAIDIPKQTRENGVCCYLCGDSSQAFIQFR